MSTARAALLVLLIVTTALGVARVEARQSMPVPRPFPGAPAPPPAAPRGDRPAPAQSPAAPAQAPASPATPAVPASSSGAPAPADLGNVPLFPAAQFIDSFDAGQGQHYYLYGTNAAFADVVAFYKNALKSGGRELYRTPAMQQFDLGKFQDDAMAYPPSVVVKDYTWNNSPGYLAVSGTTSQRFKTVIQIVPPPAAHP